MLTRVPSGKSSKETVEAPWVADWHREPGADWSRMLYQLAEHNPAEVRRIRRTCTWADVLTAYKHWYAGQQGLGWRFID